MGSQSWTQLGDFLLGFPDSPVGKESASNAGDPGCIPGSGSSTGEGIGYPFQYSWASLVTQLVKNLLAMQETWLRSLGWEDPLEKGPAKSLINKDLKSDRKLLVSNSALGNILCCLKYKILTIV